MTNKERAQAIITDIRVNHLPRVIEGLDKGYIDENQIMVILDHAYRARILQESCEFCHGTGRVIPSYVNISDPCPCTLKK